MPCQTDFYFDSVVASQKPGSTPTSFRHTGSQQNPKLPLSVSAPSGQQPLWSPALSSETHSHCTRLSSLAQAEWEGEGLFLFGFKRYNSSALTCIYSFFLPSGHLLFLLLPSAVINICIPLTSRQPKACPKCVTVPVLDSLTWWWGNRVFISSCPWLHSTERGVCFMVPCN